MRKFDKIIKTVLEGAYIHTKASVAAYKDQEAASAKIAEYLDVLNKNPNDYDALKDAYNIINTFEGNDFVVNNKVVTKVDILKHLLEITKTPEHDYTILKRYTIDEYKAMGGSEAYYHLYKNMIDSIGEYSKPRSRRETSEEGNQPIYYFGPDGEPYKTSVFVPPSGVVDKSFWRGNRMGGKLLPPPAPFNKYTPSQLRGKTLEEIRDAVDHKNAKKAFEQKYPPNDPKFAAFYKKLR